MSRRSVVLVGVFLVAVAAGCDARARNEEKLVRLRQERRELLSALYKEYGGADLAKAASGVLSSDGGGVGTVTDAIAGAVTEHDRESFDAACARLGDGERPGVLTTKAREFFERPAVKDRCAEVSRLARDAARLEAKMAEGG